MFLQLQRIWRHEDKHSMVATTADFQRPAASQCNQWRLSLGSWKTCTCHWTFRQELSAGYPNFWVFTLSYKLLNCLQVLKRCFKVCKVSILQRHQKHLGNQVTSAHLHVQSTGLINQSLNCSKIGKTCHILIIKYLLEWLFH